MLIYGAQAQAKPGKAGEAAAGMAKQRAILTRIAERPVYAWAIAGGAPIGGFAMSSRLENFADMTAVLAAMGGDAEYQAMSAEIGELWAVPSETTVAEVVAASGEPGEPKAITAVTRSTMANGHMANALAVGNEILEYVTNVTGLSGLLTSSAAGNLSEMNVIFGADDGGQLDAANAALMADAGYIELVDKAGPSFVDGSAHRFIMMALP